MPTMDRRDFLRVLGFSGLAATAAPSVFGRAHAADPVEGGYTGPFYVHVHCSGGWDPTLLCDPKGRANENDPEPVNMYFTDEIQEIGAFRVAPVEGHAAFFERMKNDLLVINGVDAQTNSHETGSRYVASGSMNPGYPALAALAAAKVEPRPTLAFVSHGGYDLTDGLVGATRLPDGNTILEVAYPDRLSVSDPSSSLFPEAIRDRIALAHAERLDRLTGQASLPRIKRAMGLLQQARASDNDLARLAEILPDNLSSFNGMARQAAVTMSAFKAGVAVSASLVTGGFDTHGNHDASHTPRMQDLIRGLTTLMDEAERYGIADQIIVVVGSDFARTPWYNDGNGKDHWSISSMMMWGPGIRGGRVLGGSDERQVSIDLDLDTLKPSSGGGRITYEHVHASIRELLGLQGWETAERYALGETLSLFT